MPLPGPIHKGGNLLLSPLRSTYSVKYSRRSKADSNIAECVVCRLIMDRSDSTKTPIYKLVHRPEDA